MIWCRKDLWRRLKGEHEDLPNKVSCLSNWRIQLAQIHSGWVKGKQEYSLCPFLLPSARSSLCLSPSTEEGSLGNMNEGDNCEVSGACYMYLEGRRKRREKWKQPSTSGVQRVVKFKKRRRRTLRTTHRENAREFWDVLWHCECRFPWAFFGRHQWRYWLLLIVALCWAGQELHSGFSNLMRFTQHDLSPASDKGKPLMWEGLESPFLCPNGQFWSPGTLSTAFPDFPFSP